MGLNNRGTLDPRFPFHARPVVRGAMLAEGILYHVAAFPGGVPSWFPESLLNDDRQPKASATFIPVYQGPCRVQPALDWRSRRQNWRDQATTEQTSRVQLDFRSNQLEQAEVNAGLQFPVLHIDDIFRVTKVHELRGYKADAQLLLMKFVVQNYTTSSNSWECNLSCSMDMAGVGEFDE